RNGRWVGVKTAAWRHLEAHGALAQLLIVAAQAAELGFGLRQLLFAELESGQSAERSHVGRVVAGAEQQPGRGRTGCQQERASIERKSRHGWDRRVGGS